MTKLKLIIISVFVFLTLVSSKNLAVAKTKHWEIQSIDTMKISRDLAREKSEDETFDEIINHQVKLIAETGATHVAIGTPYDEEFIPYMEKWVDASRRYDLNVWFRGNFS